MIKFLARIHILQLTWSDQPSPQAVPRCSIAESEPCQFERIYHTIVRVCGVVYPERQSRIWFQVLLGKFLYPVLAERSLYF